MIGAASLPPLIEAWLGRGYGEAALLGAFLVLGSAAGLSTGTGVAYMRAIGQPGLEARMGPLIVAVNLALTIPLAFAAGARGVVIGTLGAYVIGASWFFSRLHRHVPASPVRSPPTPRRARRRARRRRRLARVRPAAVALLPGRAALPVVALGVACALLAYAAVAAAGRADAGPPAPRDRRSLTASAAPLLPARRRPGPQRRPPDDDRGRPAARAGARRRLRRGLPRAAADRGRLHGGGRRARPRAARAPAPTARA